MRTAMLMQLVALCALMPISSSTVIAKVLVINIAIRNTTDSDIRVFNRNTIIGQEMVIGQVSAGKLESLDVQLHLQSPSPACATLRIEAVRRSSIYKGTMKNLNENDDKKTYSVSINKDNTFQIDEIKK